MKTYKQIQKVENIIEKVFCNNCGEEILIENNQEYFHGEMSWGYYSNRDGKKDDFDLCCDCYDKIINNFKISLSK